MSRKEKVAKEFTVEQWNVEAGPTYFDETVTGVQQAIEEADKAIKDRGADSLIKKK
jgi:hypothetical protein